MAVDDLLACLSLLRAVCWPAVPDALRDTLGLDLARPTELRLGGGHAVLDSKLLRLMGERVISAGAVIAITAHRSLALCCAPCARRRNAPNRGGPSPSPCSKRGGGATELSRRSGGLRRAYARRLAWRRRSPRSPACSLAMTLAQGSLCDQGCGSPLQPRRCPREETAGGSSPATASRVSASAGDPFAQAQAPLLADMFASVAFHPRLGTLPRPKPSVTLAVAESRPRAAPSGSLTCPPEFFHRPGSSNRSTSCPARRASCSPTGQPRRSADAALALGRRRALPC